MSKSDWNLEQAIRERAYLIWEREGRPDGRADDHWRCATIEAVGHDGIPDDEPLEVEEKILAGRPDVNIPALLTKYGHGG